MGSYNIVHEIMVGCCMIDKTITKEIYKSILNSYICHLNIKDVIFYHDGE